MSIIGDILSSALQSMKEGFSSLIGTTPAEINTDTQLHGLNVAEEILGNLKTQELRCGTVRVGTVELPALVAKQLRELGHPIETYSPGQLKEAIDACAVDGNLFDDHDGVNFSDSLHLDPREVQEDMSDYDVQMMSYRRCAGRVHAPSSRPPEEEKSWVDHIGGAPPHQSHNNFTMQLHEERTAASTMEHATAA